MGEHDALGQPGRSARVREHHHVFSRIDLHGGRSRWRPQQLGEGPGALGGAEDEDLLDPRRRGRLLGLVEEGRHRDEEAGARILELLGQLARSVERISELYEAIEEWRPDIKDKLPALQSDAPTSASTAPNPLQTVPPVAIIVQNEAKAQEFYQIVDKLERETEPKSDEKLHALGFSYKQIADFIGQGQPTSELQSIIANSSARRSG